MTTADDRRARYYNDAAILVRLAKGPATSGDLAKAVYGTDDYGRRAVWVAIHRLRKRGVDIITETAGNWERDWEQYRLGSVATCPCCGGAGVVVPCDSEGKA